MLLKISYRERNDHDGNLTSTTALSYDIKEGCLFIDMHNTVRRIIPLDRIAHIESDLRG